MGKSRPAPAPQAINSGWSSADMPGIEGDLFRELGRAFNRQLGQASAFVDQPLYKTLPQNPAQAAPFQAPQFDQQAYAQNMQRYLPQIPQQRTSQDGGMSTLLQGRGPASYMPQNPGIGQFGGQGQQILRNPFQGGA